jgi:aminocarboxymuconate-semialdehyde decarboxylase
MKKKNELIPENAVIDFHSHLWDDEYLNFLARYDRKNLDAQRGYTSNPEQLKKRFDAMDKAKINLQILSATPILADFHDETQAVMATQLINNRYLELTVQYPDRFLMFMALPLPHIEASLKEIARIYDEQAVVGIALNSSIHQKSILEPIFEPIFAELDRRKSILYLHPEGAGACSPLVQGANNIWMTGTIIEDTAIVTELITKEIPIRYPHIKIINSHGGGALPMVMQRMDNQTWEAPRLTQKPSDIAKKMWYDTALHASPIAIKALVEAVGAEQVVLGTDFPYIHFKDGNFHKNTDFIQDNLSQMQSKQILKKNGEALINRTNQ